MNKILITIIAIIFLIAIINKIQKKESSITEDSFSIISWEESNTTPEFIKIEKVNNRIKEDSLYADIINHSRTPSFKGDSRMFHAHETTHKINSDIRRKYKKDRLINGFYLGDGLGVIIEEPNMKKKEIQNFVPEILKSKRYLSYIKGQDKAWGDQPLFVFDEWVAYVNDARVGIEDVRNGKKINQIDGVMCCLEFSIYSIATAMAIEKHDPKYWKENKQFRDFLIWHLKRSRDTFFEVRDTKEFRYEIQEQLLKDLREHSEAQLMRKFIEENLENVWL